jgi:uncharacterized protein with beta-barrel porin domain
MHRKMDGTLQRPYRMAIATLALTTLPAMGAQAGELLDGNLAGTQLQIDTGIGIQTVCIDFIENGRETDLEEALFRRCGEMVHTYRKVTGVTDEGATALALDLTEAELAAALQQIAMEETSAPGSMATEAARGQLAGVAARISAVRGGASGFTVTGLPLPASEAYAGATELALNGPYFVSSAGAPANPPSLAPRVGGFLNLTGGFGEKDATDREDGFDFDTVGLTVGGDYRLTDGLLLGVALGYATLDTDFDRGATVAGGGVSSDHYSLSVYATQNLGDFYVDGIATYGWGDHDLDRRILYDVQDRTARADTDSSQIALAIGGGYEAHHQALSFGPQVRLSYLKVEIDGYQEHGADELDLRVEDQEVESLVTVVGGQVAYTHSHAGGVLRPHATAEWHHELDDDDRVIATRYVHDPRDNLLQLTTDPPDRDYFLVGVGLASVFKGGTQALLSYDALVGLDDITRHMFTLSGRVEF